jgi:hypothetical protein
VRKSRTTKMKRTIGVAALLLLCSCFARSATITGVTQSWTYNRVDGSGTLTILNQTQKAITGYCAAISEDSKEAHNYHCIDLMPLVITVLQSSDPALHEKYGDGTFLPGTSRDMVLHHSVTDDYTTVKAEVVVVSYADGTVESTDARGLYTLMASRQREVTTLQQVNKTIKETLADPRVSDHYAAIRTELTRLDAISKNKNDGLGLEWNIKNLPKDDATLSGLVKENEQRIALMQKSVQAPEVQVGRSRL